jgi:hypothetical protein
MRPNRFLVLLCAGCLLALLGLLAASCGRSAVPTTTPTPTRTPTRMPSPTRVLTATATGTPTRTPTATRNPSVNPLTGLAVPPANLQRLPILARIGNDPQIRPQAGLAQADIVYEDIMDGWWVTRLTAIYLGTDPETIGPIRSARLVNIELANQYQGALVHSGASDRVRWLISQEDFVNLDEFFHPQPYYYINSLGWMGRLHTTGKAIREYLSAKGWERPVQLRGFCFSQEVPAGEMAKEVSIPYPATSAVTFQYDESSGRYLRWVQGAPHLDRESGKQLSASNVIVQFVPHEKTDIVEDTNGATSIRIVMTGRGEAWLFRDGVVLKGFWERNGKKEMTRFLDSSGRELCLKPGQTWVELVPPGYEIAYK